MHALTMALLLFLQPPRDTPRRPVVLTDEAVVLVEEGRFEALEFRLTNNTSGAITGHGVRYAITFADGTKRSGGFGLPGPLNDRDPLWSPVQAHSTATIRHVLGPVGPTISDVSVNLVWAIFGDRSFVGEATEVKHAFDSRERRFEQQLFVIKALNAARAEATGVDALRAALRRVAEAPGNMTEALTHVRGNLQRAIDGKVPIDPDTYLLTMIRTAEEERDFIEPHRARR